VVGRTGAGMDACINTFLIISKAVKPNGGSEPAFAFVYSMVENIFHFDRCLVADTRDAHRKVFGSSYIAAFVVAIVTKMGLNRQILVNFQLLKCLNLFGGYKVVACEQTGWWADIVKHIDIHL
jgi:hypothetical protein